MREVIRKRFGSRRSSLSQLVEEALREHIHPRSDITNAALIEAVDLIAYMVSQGKPKAEILANLGFC